MKAGASGLELTGEYQRGQMGQTVNLLVFTFGGSNPSSPTKRQSEASLIRAPRDLTEIAEVAQLIEH